MSRPVESPFIDHEVLAPCSAEEWESTAEALAAGSPFLHEVEDGRLFEALVPKVSQADLRSRIDEYFRLAAHEYTIPAHKAPGGAAVPAAKVRARPQFRFARNDSEKVMSDADTRLHRLVGSSLGAANRKAILHAVLGRAKPREIAAITQALIDRGELDAVRAAHPGKSNRYLVRALQRKSRIGIDCAGYVQLAFIHAYTGSDDDPRKVREDLGLKALRTAEALRDLPAKHFTRVPIVDARTGDLFVLRPQADSDGSWHTVIVKNRSVSGSVHTFVVHASWGVDMFGVSAGGVGERRWQHDTSNGKWWDLAPRARTVCEQAVKAGEKACVNTIGPYDGHRPYGMFRATEK